MKITRIEIAKHLQFKDFELDLTYPKGHEKEGQPLDKVCIIGQNGTGKTTLLNLLYAFGEKMEIDGEINKKNESYFPEDSSFKIQVEGGNFYLEKKDNDKLRLWSKSSEESYEYIDHSNFSVNKNGKIYQVSSFVLSNASFYDEVKSRSKLFTFITTDILAQFDYLSQPIKEEKKLIGMAGEEDMDLKKVLQSYKREKNIKVDSQTNADIWKYIFKEIDIFDKKVAQKNQELFKKMTTKDAEKVFKEFIEWKQTQINPRVLLAEILNEIVSFFNIKVDPEEMEYYITVLTKNGEVHIPHEALSTGTKQIILTTALLWGMGLGNSIVLVDEAECSLYPDTQRKIIDFYTKISETSQYIFATHSPIIAASFEPWEIVELVFDNEGNVKPRKYYEGERHIDNYFIDFRYLRWDDILQKGFGMTEEGNSEFRERELTKALSLRARLEKMRSEGKDKTEDYQKKLTNYLITCKRLGWNIHEKN